MSEKYDAIIIGAGMSGLAAAIRLGMFDKKVLVLEKHVISGGLNSYYSRRIRETKELLDKIKESYTPQEESNNESETDNTESENTEV